MKARINEHGGTVPQNEEARERALNADLGTLPEFVDGTNCGSCLYVDPLKDRQGVVIGLCRHPEVKQLVSSRMCCAFWDAQGFIRADGTVTE